MATVSLTAKPRDTKGKGNARKLRQTGEVPAVIYGHSREPQSLSLNTRDVEKLLTQIAGTSTVVELAIDGKTARTLIREVQRHPFKRQVLHVDFQELVAGEKVTLSVPIRFHGTPTGVRENGGILEEILHQLHLRVDPMSIPDHIDVDVTPLTIGHSFHIRDLQLPEGAEIMDDEDATVCLVSAPRAVVDETPAAAAEGGAVPEPELIRKAKPDEEEEKKK
ncbi:MAG TPA: 50S ribosomal protein L25/general stress protein Ctc [Gemmatimonadaceae bacterium]|nr:50S ribosomal protein L25/general stress protein Ctc [Gemmatimonadaceae bacterium]